MDEGAEKPGCGVEHVMPIWRYVSYVLEGMTTHRSLDSVDESLLRHQWSCSLFWTSGEAFTAKTRAYKMAV